MTTATTHGLTIDGAKSRYSQAYLSSICAQAGATMSEARQDEDVHAIDVKVDLQLQDVNVQLKCTQSPRKTKIGIRIDLEDGWITRWRLRLTPVYVVGIVVPSCQAQWIEHHDEATHHRTRAYWQKFDPRSDAKSIVLPYTNRLTAETLTQWREDLSASFFSGGGEHE